MGCGNLFGTTTNTSNQSTQSGNANTSNNLWNDPGVQSFFQQYQNQYSPSNIAGVQAPVNSYETNAANAQSGLAAPATGIANNGISTADIQRFMSPYIQSVVDPTERAINQQNQMALSNINGSSALKGALGNNTGQQAAYYAGVEPGQTAEIANLYNQGFGQASNLAGQSAQTQLAGVNAATGANTAAFGQGQGIQQTNLQNQLLPFSLTDQAATGIQNYGNLAGTNVNTSGTSSGTGTSTTSPGAGTVGLGILGALASFSAGGSVTPSATANGAGSDDFHGKVMKAFHMIQGMKEHARGGMVHRDMGGDVGLGSWAPVVTPATPDGPTSLQKLGGGLADFSKNLGGAKPADTGLGQSQSALAQMVSGAAAASALRPMRPYGGAVDDDAGDAPSWGSRAWDALGNFFHVPDSVKAGLEAYPAAAQRIMANPEGTASGLARGVLNAFPVVGPTANLMEAAPEVVRGFASLGRPPQASAMASVPDDDGMTPYGPAVYGDREMAFAPPADTASASPVSIDEQSSITPGRETLPWKVGASDVPPPVARPTASAAVPASSGHWYDGISMPFSKGVWAGEQATPRQRFGLALTQFGAGNPAAGFGKAAMDYSANAPIVSRLQSEALKAAHDTSLDYQIQSSNALAAAQRQQEIQRMQGLNTLAKQMNMPLAKVAAMTAKPPTPPPVPGAEWYPDWGGWHVPDPNRPGKFLKYNP